MPEYVKIDGLWLSACSDCGATVISEDIHTRWHEYSGGSPYWNRPLK